jgi:S1-C subfamily serine protease
VVLLLALMLALAGWSWMHRTTEGHLAQLTAALERGKSLQLELAAIKPADPLECAPGETLQAIPTLPPAAAAPAQTPPPSQMPSAPPTSGNADPLDDRALAQRLEQATAMVVVAEGGRLSTGTGFFITPNLFVTNRHVVEGATQQVALVSEALKSLRRATVLRKTSGSEVGSPDFALLRLDEGTAPGTLDASNNVSKLSGVVAAGFPGVVVQNDSRFRRLLGGDLAAAPDLNLTQGTVQSLQSGTGGMPLIVHTASIAKGNSGGPLVDSCGRLVGVNTFINVDKSQSAKINYAIRAEVMQAFLRAAGASARIDDRTCARS